MYIADLHIHSRFSRATSREGDLPHLDLWARRKGIRVVGTGDFTHPAWRRELQEQLLPAGEGLYALREELRLPFPQGGLAARNRRDGAVFGAEYTENGLRLSAQVGPELLAAVKEYQIG